MNKTVLYVIGAVGVAVGAGCVVEGLTAHVPLWIGSGAWIIAFSAGLIVWTTNRARPPKAGA